MPRKTLRVQVELDIQAVTCPGVWLCPNGKVSLQLFMLDSCIQTNGLPPVFPLLYHEKFIFYKNFYSAYSLSELQRLINREYLFAELVQWQNCDTGNVIATFQSSLYDVLYPSSYEGAIAGVDVDLLMEPSKIFPGIIAPKIEISTRTTVEEIVCLDDKKKQASYAVNPKTVSSDPCSCEPKTKHIRQQRVCHSVGYHRNKKCTKLRRKGKPPFAYRRAEEDILDRPREEAESGRTKKCKCRNRSQSLNTLVDNQQDQQDVYYSQSPTEYCYPKGIEELYNRIPRLSKGNGNGTKKGKTCACGNPHRQDNCPLCSKYSYYFEDGEGRCECNQRNKRRGRRGNEATRDSFVKKVPTSSPVRERNTRSDSRQPVNTVGRESQHQSRGCNRNSLPSRASVSNTEGRVCNCSPGSNDDRSSKLTFSCSPPKKPSLAEQLHHRLQQALDCAPPFPAVQCPHQSISGNASVCSCPKFRNCKEGFYRTLGKFYRDLRNC